MLLSPARGRGWVRGRRTSIPPHLASPPSGGEEHERGGRERRGHPALPDRRGVLEAALGPQLVQAAVDLEGRLRAEVAVEALAVVTDLLDDGVDPLLVDPQGLAHAWCHAKDALDGGVV